MLFGILGETRAWHDDGTEVPLGGPARRALLALLLLNPGEAVSADRLADALDPDGALSAHALQSQVSRLRKSLGAAAAIEQAGAGYRIVVAPDDVDACRFERLAREGRAALRSGEAGRAVVLLREALELWRGPALDGLDGSESGRPAAVRLEERRLGAIEDRIEAECLLGGHHTAVPELRELVGRHPLRERLAGLLMRALFAEGGQAAALVVFEETRRHLADELGADPSAELVSLHRELLSADPSPAPAAPPAQLTAFVGRGEEVSEVAGLLRVARLVTLTGPGGVGKTRLSVEVAGTLADEVCFVELAPLRDGTGVAQALLGALGLRENGLTLGDGAQAPVDRLVAALSDRMLLLVLDNCEHVVDEAAALAARLLAACPRLRVLATSREPLGIIGESIRQVRPLDGDAAVRLFTDRAGAVRHGFTADPKLVRRICAALDDLPLAIELAAARVRTLDVEDLAGRLDDRLGVAARGSRTADERHRTLRSVVAWSWDLLSEAEQCAARRFTVFAGGATAGAALRVCGADEELLESLVDKSLLEVAGAATGCWRRSARTAASGSTRRVNGTPYDGPTPGGCWSWYGPPTRICGGPSSWNGCPSSPPSTATSSRRWAGRSRRGTWRAGWSCSPRPRTTCGSGAWPPRSRRRPSRCWRRWGAWRTTGRAGLRRTGSARGTCCACCWRRPVPAGGRCGSATVRRPVRPWPRRGRVPGRAAIPSPCSCG
ncbi:BTAD domain-containing putative transcriptional regulator [Streptomyces nojiriensis]